MGQAASFDSYPEFIIRTPVFPLDKISQIPFNPDKLAVFVEVQMKNPVIRDAIRLASPGVFESLVSQIDQQCLSEGMLYTFLRYFIRMCSRPTPFGCFAGISAGRITDETVLMQGLPGGHRLNCRLDMEFLGALVMKWARDPNIRQSLNYYPNTSLYKIESKWRYVEVFFLGDARKKYRIVAIDHHPVLEKIIEESTGLLSWADLIDLITGMGYQEDEAAVFLNELLDSQVLVNEWYPSLTGIEYSRKLAGKIENMPLEFPGFQNYMKLLEKLGQISGPGTLGNFYPEIFSLATDSGITFKPSHLIQGDLLQNYETAAIGKDISNQVLMGIRILKSLSVPKTNNTLEEFKNYFEERFGSRKIPLPLVMDTEFGIGINGPQGQQIADPGPLLDGLDFPIEVNPSGPRLPNPLLLDKINAERNDPLYIDLDKNDIKRLGIRKGQWPQQMFAMGRLTGTGEDISVVFETASAGNPSFLLGRFGFLEPGGKINKHLKDLVNDEINNHPGEMLSDIVHLPEDRTGNILQRPSVYEYEIAYLAGDSEMAQSISPNDILVSVKNRKILLHHRISGKVIIPRLTNAHNYKHAQLPMYQFLAEYAAQYNNVEYSVNWGWLADINKFLPGIRYGGIVLSLPVWRIIPDDDLLKPGRSRVEQYGQILEWAKKNGLPEKLFWIEGDHELLIDWSNINIVMAAWDAMKTRGRLTFKAYPYEGRTPVKSSDGVHANQVLFSYRKSTE